MLKKIKKIWGKCYVQLFLIIVPVSMGLVGYVAYYNAITPKDDWTLWTPFTSSLKLFTFIMINSIG